MALFELDRTSLDDETEAEAEGRRAAVRTRRSDVFVTVHRGAWYLAPENTLAAYQAALDLGADGLEIDVRRTGDHRLVLFHDHAIDRLLDGVGLLEDMYYEELMLYPFREDQPGPERRHFVPTLGQGLKLLRARRGFAHLDVKSAGIDQAIVEALDRSGLWDHVVLANEYNADAIRHHPRYEEAPMRCSFAFYREEWHTIVGAEDADWDAILVKLSQPGLHIQADDPRLILEALGRRVGTLTPLAAMTWPDRATPPEIDALAHGLLGTDPCFDSRLAGARLVNWYGEEAGPMVARHFSPSMPVHVRRDVAWALGMAARHYPGSLDEQAHDCLLLLAQDLAAEVRAEAARALGLFGEAEDVELLVPLALQGHEMGRVIPGDPAEERRRCGLTQVRAAAAESLGRLGQASPPVLSALTSLIARPAAHWDNELASGADGAAAAIALARLEARESADVLAALLGDEPEAPAGGSSSLTDGAEQVAWYDYRARREAARSLGLLASGAALNRLALLLSGFPKQEAHWRSDALAAAVAALATRTDPPARSVCAEALFSRLPSVSREAFFRLWEAPRKELTAEAVARAILRRLHGQAEMTRGGVAVQLLGYLGHRSAMVQNAVAAAQAAPDEAIRRRAECAASKLGLGRANRR